MKQRKTKQQQLVLDYLKNNRIHPDALKLYEIMQMNGESVGIATIYRNLKKLEDMGEILRIKVQGKPDAFDAFGLDHIHFVCDNCKKIDDIDDLELIKYVKSRFKKYDYDITGCDLVLKGLCENCRGIDEKV